MNNKELLVRTPDGSLILLTMAPSTKCHNLVSYFNVPRQLQREIFLSCNSLNKCVAHMGVALGGALSVHQNANHVYTIESSRWATKLDDVDVHKYLCDRERKPWEEKHIQVICTLRRGEPRGSADRTKNANMHAHTYTYLTAICNTCCNIQSFSVSLAEVWEEFTVLYYTGILFISL